MKESKRVNVTVMQDEKDRTGHRYTGRWKECDSPQKLRKAREQLSPRASTKEHGPSDTQILAQGFNLQTPDLQLSLRIKLCCFKPLSLW